MEGGRRIQEEPINTPKFTLEEVGDLIKNKQNLAYLLELNGRVTRLPSSSRKDDDSALSQASAQRR